MTSAVATFATPGEQQPSQACPQQQSAVDVETLLTAIEACCHSAADEHGTAVPRDQMTPFHSSGMPPYSLATMASAIHDRLGVEPLHIICAAVLMRRFAEATAAPVTGLMIHRLFLAALQVSLKMHADHFYNNRVLSSIAGAQPGELCRLEAALLATIEWRCMVSGSDITSFVAWALAPHDHHHHHHDTHVAAADQAQPCDADGRSHTHPQHQPSTGTGSPRRRLASSATPYHATSECPLRAATCSCDVPATA